MNIITSVMFRPTQLTIAPLKPGLAGDYQQNSADAGFINGPYWHRKIE
ncbi:MAG: hypothetical protein O3C43_01905 [Verrucomicrobia bacterium]|nr:hypothetical protein [Verrucomicrobiota bacterium]MDA1065236.1 hypothetical protein [Verrucomicrobiota bacterium]